MKKFNKTKSNFSKLEVNELRKLIMHNTLPEKHFTNNERKDYLEKHHDEIRQFGQIVLYSSKENFGSKGLVLDNMSDFYKASNKYTHFTPNTYFGINKDNLTTTDRKINAVNILVIDIDCKDEQDALWQFADRIQYGLDITENINPCYVLLTDKGLQVGYIFSEPIYLGRRYEKQLYSINEIYKNIVSVLKSRFKSVVIDEKNTAFGIQRLPSTSNLLALSVDNTVDFLTARDWSMCVSNVKRTGKKNNKKFVPKIIFGKNRQVENNWYIKMTSDEQLLKVNHEGARDNLFTTLALANKNSEVDQSECEKNLQKFNSKTRCPLSARIITQKVNSVYRGHCKGAQSNYINLIIDTYNLNIELIASNKNASGGRLHRKMNRQHRTKLHVSERVDSLINALNGSNKDTLTRSELESALEYNNGSFKSNHLKTLNKDSRINIKKVKGGKYKIKIEKTFLNARGSKAG